MLSDVFTAVMVSGFVVQALKLYPKRGFDWLTLANVGFAVLYFTALFVDSLRVVAGLATIVAFIRPTMDRSRDLRFRLSHLAVLIVAAVYVWVNALQQM